MCRSQVFPFTTWVPGIERRLSVLCMSVLPTELSHCSTVFFFPTASETSLMAKASIHALSSPVYNVAAPYRLVEWMMNESWALSFQSLSPVSLIN